MNELITRMLSDDVTDIPWGVDHREEMIKRQKHNNAIAELQRLFIAQQTEIDRLSEELRSLQDFVIPEGKG